VFDLGQRERIRSIEALHKESALLVAESRRLREESAGLRRQLRVAAARPTGNPRPRV
jgi:ABC-type Na+ transport system ATPase subunit NatA